MSRHEPSPTDAEIRRDLGVLDEALAGVAAGQPHVAADADAASLAAFTVTLASLRPQPTPEFARTLDERAATGFVREGRRAGATAGAGDGGRARLAPSVPPALRNLAAALPARLRAASARPVLGLAVALALVAAIGVVTLASSSSHRRAAPAAGNRFAQQLAPATVGTQTGGAGGALQPESRSGTTRGPSSGVKGTSTNAPAVQAGGPAVAPVPSEAGTGTSGPSRQVELSASLDIGVSPDQIQPAAQHVFGIVSSLGGYVRRSSVNSGSGSGPAPGSGEAQAPNDQGGATFDIRIPSARLSAAIASLSHLGHVRAENDTTNDVTGHYDSLTGTLRRARAERASLLAQLAGATSGASADKLNARLRALDGRIGHLEGSLHALTARIDYTPLALSLTPEHAAAGAGQGDLTPGAAAGEAAHILEAALAVLLIGLAAALPLALAVLAGRILLLTSRRRLREQALDAR